MASYCVRAFKHRVASLALPSERVLLGTVPLTKGDKRT